VGECWVKAAECEMKLKAVADAATSFKEAGMAYKKVSQDDAKKYFDEAIHLYCDEGRFATAAKIEKEIAEMYEADEELREAIEHYEKAAGYFSGENEKAQCNQCRVKIATFSATLEKYEPAIEIFEDIGKTQLENNLLKFNAKGNFLNAGLCKLAVPDVVSCKIAVDRYKDYDYTFASSRECKFLEDLCQAIEDMDAESLSTVVFEYDSISKLNPWTVTLLLRVKEKLKESCSGAAEDLT
jgi:alpha-soluble NSF attachment protein